MENAHSDLGCTQAYRFRCPVHHSFRLRHRERRPAAWARRRVELRAYSPASRRSSAPRSGETPPARNPTASATPPEALPPPRPRPSSAPRSGETAAARIPLRGHRPGRPRSPQPRRRPCPHRVRGKLGREAAAAAVQMHPRPAGGWTGSPMKVTSAGSSAMGECSKLGNHGCTTKLLHEV
ncbi:hypothetical protein BDA96_03G209400 [Sorghum bicolor]|uniref:Uncharacterized protein n=1 Tax=Sorghum bicolor TaxID=4558 RepID=A0A921UMX4_SORBI|nr:hypothetical protein BDA96_03G209400 [Sorghum bicolor]